MEALDLRIYPVSVGGDLAHCWFHASNLAEEYCAIVLSPHGFLRNFVR
jgi:hypothetical protein